MMSERHHLHPVAVVIQAMITIRQFIIPLGFWAVIQLRNTGIDAVFWLLLGSIVILLLTFAWEYVYWKRYTYRIEHGEFRIEHGVVYKKRRYIPLERIQSVDYVEGILHRLFGVVKVRVETAGGAGPEAELQAVTREEAEQLRNVLTVTRTVTDPGEHNVDPDQAEDKTQNVRRWRLKTGELMILGLTSGSLGVIFPIIGGAFSFLAEFFPVESLFAFIGRYIHVEATFQFISFALVVTFVVALASSIVTNALKFGKFSLTRSGDHLLLERGLLERRRSTIPIRRIQAVRLEEGILRQPIDRVTVRVVSAGYGGEGDNDPDTSTVIFPLLKKKEVMLFLREFLPELTVEEIGFTKVPRRSWRRFVTVKVVLATLISVPLSYFFYPWGLLALLLVPLAVLYGHLCYRDEGWYLAGEDLVLRSRFLTRTTTIVTRRRIQSSTVKQSPFQRPSKLATFQVAIIGWLGRNVNVRHIDQRDASQLLEWASHRRPSRKQADH